MGDRSMPPLAPGAKAGPAVMVTCEDTGLGFVVIEVTTRTLARHWHAVGLLVLTPGVINKNGTREKWQITQGRGKITQDHKEVETLPNMQVLLPNWSCPLELDCRVAF